MFHGDKAPITTIDSLSIRNRLSLSYLGMCRLSKVQQGTALCFARNWKDCARNWAELVKQGTVTDRRLTYCYIFLSSVVNDRLPLPAHIWVGFLFVEAFFIGEYFHWLQMTISTLRGPQNKIISQFGIIIGSLSFPSSLRSLTEIFCILCHSERNSEEGRRWHIPEEVFSFSNTHVCKHLGWRSSPTTNHERNFKIA